MTYVGEASFLDFRVWLSDEFLGGVLEKLSLHAGLLKLLDHASKQLLVILMVSGRIILFKSAILPGLVLAHLVILPLYLLVCLFIHHYFSQIVIELLILPFCLTMVRLFLGL